MLDMEWAAAEAGIPRVTVLHGHTSQDTAYVQEDYPYGRELRCQRRVWLETNKRGTRFVTQTSNPQHGQDWRNKPKASVYSPWAVLVIEAGHEDEHDGPHVTYYGAGPNIGPAQVVRYTVCGFVDGLSVEERKTWDVLVKMGRRFDHRDWERWTTETIPLAAKMRADLGRMPTAEEMTKVGHYVNSLNMPAVVVALLTGYTPG